jgi:hypothetical protein
MSRRSIQVFNMSFLDMMTNFLGAVIILFLLAANEMSKRPFPNVKATAKVVYNDLTRDINGKIDLSVLTPTVALRPGDTLLVIVEKTISKKAEEAVAPPPPPRPNQGPTGGVIVNEDQVVVDKKKYEEALKNPEQAECALFADVVKISPCNDKGTPENGDDDTYTVDIKVSAAGKCSSTQLWKDNKGTGATPYSSAKTYTFKIKDGQQTITVSDMSSPVSKSVTINPPASCVKKVVVVDPPEFPPPPGLNFQIEFDEANANANVDLYVEKSGRWVYGARKNDDDIGRWDNAKRGFLSPGKTGIEKVTQLDVAHQPGTYKVYAHLKPGKTAPSSIKVKLFISSQKGNQSKRSESNVNQTERGPKSGGGVLLKTVTVGADGKFTIR